MIEVTVDRSNAFYFRNGDALLYKTKPLPARDVALARIDPASLLLPFLRKAAPQDAARITATWLRRALADAKEA